MHLQLQRTDELVSVRPMSVRLVPSLMWAAMSCRCHGRWKYLKVGGASSVRGHGERVEREPITGVWKQSPQRGPGAEPLVEGQGVKPP